VLSCIFTWRMGSHFATGGDRWPGAFRSLDKNKLANDGAAWG
jgi:hypothetical protein